MKFILNKKDIVSMNMRFDQGKLHNEGSLDFALSYCKKTENWTKALALLTRAILIDHVFEEGNKRTAALAIKTYADIEGYETYDDRILLMIKEILLKNITNITKIEDMIKNAIK
ncbi:MAG: hypothetical protein WC471_02255 [Candidatus Woesearchaeota archaeon]